MSLAQSTLWSQDSLVSRPVQQVSAEVRLMLAGSGQKYAGSFDPRGPLGCFWRTFLASSAWDSMTYSAIWSLRATKRRRVYIRLRRLGRRTRGNGCSSSAISSESLWLTPNASDENGGKVARPGLTNTRIGPSGKKQQLSLKQQVREQRETHRNQWPTPVAGNGTGTRAFREDGTPYPNHEPSLTLVDAIRLYPPLWPTPTSTAGDGRSEQSPGMWLARRERTLAEKGIHNGLPLNVAVQMQSSQGSWPTPQARDYRSPDAPDSPRTARKAQQGWSPNLNGVVNDVVNDVAAWSTPVSRDYKGKGRDHQLGNVGKLNPAWVTQLMGFPDGWLDIEDSPSSPTDGPRDQEKRNTSGKRRAPSRPATAPQDAPQS